MVETVLPPLRSSSIWYDITRKFGVGNKESPEAVRNSKGSGIRRSDSTVQTEMNSPHVQYMHCFGFFFSFLAKHACASSLELWRLIINICLIA